MVQALYEWRKTHAAQNLTPPPADPAEYLRKLLLLTEFIDIKGLIVGGQKVHRFRIDELYITLTTSAPHGAAGKKRIEETPRLP